MDKKRTPYNHAWAWRAIVWILLVFGHIKAASSAEGEGSAKEAGPTFWGMVGISPFLAGGCIETKSSFGLGYENKGNVFLLERRHWADRNTCTEDTGNLLKRWDKVLGSGPMGGCNGLAEATGWDNLLWDVGGMYGRAMNRGWLQFSGAAGIGMIRSQRVSAAGCGGKESNAIGLPLELKMRLVPVEYLGLGLGILGNVNQRDTNFAFQAELSFGKLR